MDNLLYRVFISIFYACFCFSTVHASEEDTSLKLCFDRGWAPFTFEEQGEARGLHVDIINTAATELGFTLKFIAMPWKRCVAQLKSGLVDGVATISFKQHRGDYLFYPFDDKGILQNDLSVSVVNYILVTHKTSSVKFLGDWSDIPEPVRIPFGYSLANDLRAAGLYVDSGASSDGSNLRKLVRDKVGSAVVARHAYDVLFQYADLSGELIAHDPPVQYRSYFLAFSKQASVPQEVRRALWDKIKELRSQNGFLLSIASKYYDL